MQDLGQGLTSQNTYWAFKGQHLIPVPALFWLCLQLHHLEAGINAASSNVPRLKM